MSFVVKEDELFHPIQVGLFRPDAIVSYTDQLTGLVEQFRNADDLQFPDNPVRIFRNASISEVIYIATCICGLVYVFFCGNWSSHFMLCGSVLKGATYGGRT